MVQSESRSPPDCNAVVGPSEDVDANLDELKQCPEDEWAKTPLQWRQRPMKKTITEEVSTSC